MTHDEITALEGRELDKAVAEHVMGLQVAQVTDKQFSVWIPSVRDYVFSGDFYCYRDDENPLVLPPYSGGITAAWQVVEHLSPWLFEVQRREYDPGNMEFKAEIYLRSDNDPTKWNWAATEFAPTAPLAICRAALLAVMGEGE